MSIFDKMLEIYTDENKWTKDAYSISEKCCLAGCYRKANGLLPNGFVQIDGQYRSDWLALRQAVNELFPSRQGESCYDAAIMFNDHPRTTFSDILKVIQRAKELENEDRRNSETAAS